MSRYTALVAWQRGEAAFSDGRYSRAHVWRFDGGIEVPASASPHIVPLPMSSETAVDPEEAFVAALASCHMLFFLAIAARAGFLVDGYRDEAFGELAPNASGKLAMVRVTLRPRVDFVGRQPSQAEYRDMHHRAHEECFLSRSVTAEVVCEPV